MQETVKSTNTNEKKKKKHLKSIPSINRVDIMSGILSANVNHDERYKLSNLYAEITYMEKSDLKYINKITVSCQSDMEIYEIIRRVKKEEQKQLSSPKRANG